MSVNRSTWMVALARNGKQVKSDGEKKLRELTSAKIKKELLFIIVLFL